MTWVEWVGRNVPPLAWLVGKPIGWLWRLFDRQWQAIDADLEREREAQGVAPGGRNWVAFVVLVVAAVSLTLQEYYGARNWYGKLFPYQPGDQYYELKQFVWWSGWRFAGYLVLPVLVILLLPGERLRDYYVSFRGFFKKLPIYLVLFGAVVPMVYWAAQQTSFVTTYPFYKWANRSAFDFWAWQGLYWLQFLSLEFFFRGFLLYGLRHAMGHRAIFVMIVPYCMIHFGKPMPETLGAIGAGLILGTLAMRTRSIWGGVLIHIGVALTMDLLALQQCPPPDQGPCPGH